MADVSERALEYNPEMPSYETGWGGEAEYESEVFSEAEVLELAGQLTEVTTSVWAFQVSRPFSDAEERS